MTFILTNDDGIDAPGIRALHDAIGGKSVWVAPLSQRSGCGHQVTTSQPFQVQRRSPTRYAVQGAPADCTRVAIAMFPDIAWVLSGINAGGNLGVDAYISGTMAAVREAAIHGVRGIALSHLIKRPLAIDWEVAAHRSQQVLTELLSHPLPPGHFWNVNLPHLEPKAKEPEIIFCHPSTDPLPLSYRVEGDLYYYQGDYIRRKRTTGTDVDVCLGGNIAVTQIQL